MKKILALATILALGLCVAIAQTDVPIAATLRADGSTNTWTQGELTEALGLMNRKYWRDMETDSGRRAWHGARLQQFVSTNEQGRIVRMDVYNDGYVHVATGMPRTVKDPDAAAKAARAARERAYALLAEKESRTLPAGIAALLQARRDATETNEVTVIIQQ